MEEEYQKKTHLAIDSIFDKGINVMLESEDINYPAFMRAVNALDRMKNETYKITKEIINSFSYKEIDYHKKVEMLEGIFEKCIIHTMKVIRAATYESQS